MAQVRKIMSVTYAEQGRKTMMRGKFLSSRTMMVHILRKKLYKASFGVKIRLRKLEKAVGKLWLLSWRLGVNSRNREEYSHL